MWPLGRLRWSSTLSGIPGLSQHQVLANFILSAGGAPGRSGIRNLVMARWRRSSREAPIVIFDLIWSEMRERKLLESFDSALDVKRAKNLPILADFSWLYRHTIQLTCVGPLRLVHALHYATGTDWVADIAPPLVNCSGSM